MGRCLSRFDARSQANGDAYLRAPRRDGAALRVSGHASAPRPDRRRAAQPISARSIEMRNGDSRPVRDMDRDDPTLRDLTCRELADLLMDYLDGALPPGERASFEAHLAECEDCLVYLRSYRVTVALGKTYGAPDEGAEPEMPEELVQAILAARRTAR